MGKSTPILVALRRIAKVQNISIAQALQYYAMERFLYRVGCSVHGQNFVLKGAMLLRVWNDTSSRSTRDIDFLAFGSNDIESMKQCLSEILTQGDFADGIFFRHQELLLTPIKEHDDYQGIRARFSAIIESASIPMQLDIGFGDTVRPQIVWEHYPTLLDAPAPRIRVYSKESMIAEKVHAMVKLGIINSRLKDYYDIWTLSNQSQFERSSLVSAISATFTHRKTDIPHELIGLSPEYILAHQSMWSNYLKKSGLASQNFALVSQQIGQFLLPCLEDAKSNQSPSSVWNPVTLRWE